ncbi:ArsR/SmtB family transcription factor [Vreelandella venusta]|uniref:Helix-turn-helix transcriptional regulator n=1 Tax=Vreelandella venusta TaxID=44935 RepID=A0AAQ0CI61_9GAMM|nr:metalloregulator ArsR/SmtB family transcription factor [Halomonas venusta]QRL04255.1 helix-turn-helix transcriptional regulator [Halomonas venusta]GEK50219.1 transcriptional regulator [Halomonas venusta]
MTTNLNLVFKALADPSRRQLLDSLFENNGQALNELCERLSMSRQGVTRHLALLEEAGLVVTARRGREKLHYLNAEPIQQIHQRWVSKFTHQRIAAVDSLKQKLEDHHNE